MLRERAQRVVSSSGVTPSTLGHPTGGGAGAPKEPGNRLWKVLWGFFPQLIMVKVVVFRGKFLFQTLGIWTVTFLGNSVIPAFL